MHHKLDLSNKPSLSEPKSWSSLVSLVLLTEDWVSQGPHEDVRLDPKDVRVKMGGRLYYRGRSCGGLGNHL
ncbi:hypothetical protein KY289_001117 [Solanum tuberosum]|nr:hypothetical protein KY289_001117 [Solanum tuberosum]